MRVSDKKGVSHMKRIIVLLFLAITMTACDKVEPASQKPTTSTQQSTPTSQVTINSSNSSSEQVSSTISENSSRTVTTPQSESVTSSINTAEIVTSTEESSSQSDSNEPQNSESLYTVSLEGYNILTFGRAGMNIPTIVEFYLTDSSVNIGRAQDASLYYFIVENVPTKEIRIFSAIDNSVRTVKVNTQITIENLIDGDSSEHIGNIMYLYYNTNGTISLVTPNYAGNVMPEHADVMLEYTP